MSEDDEDGDEGPPGLPPGTPFYMTPDGAAALLLIAGQKQLVRGMTAGAIKG